jgi:hypothetical protein
MSNKQTAEVTSGGTKRNKVNTDGKKAKGTTAAILAGTAAAIAIAAKPAKVILRIGKFALTKKP